MDPVELIQRVRPVLVRIAEALNDRDRASEMLGLIDPDDRAELDELLIEMEEFCDG